MVNVSERLEIFLQNPSFYWYTLQHLANFAIPGRCFPLRVAVLVLILQQDLHLSGFTWPFSLQPLQSTDPEKLSLTDLSPVFSRPAWHPTRPDRGHSNHHWPRATTRSHPHHYSTGSSHHHQALEALRARAASLNPSPCSVLLVSSVQKKR
ncbi:hypothetical protein ElyMa_006109200 [Elysia marginata]|uniref:Uncharacterized protein n=1 Tax=Elysia marginata TaxID=1093978 RepID=A0AAV4GTH1_9GAST|nr:hypothetical protein ElyMa_006109200 [Elysia marginata]